MIKTTRRATARIAKGYEAMTPAQLREILDGMHAARDYGSEFERIARIFNDKTDGK